MRYKNLEIFVLKELEERLSPKLTYHGVHHTRDVLNVCKQYVERYDLSPTDSELLAVGALLHDAGFLYTYKEHEKKGVEIAGRILPDYEYSPTEIDTVSGLIMATKVPQQPNNLLEKIICDADLDYLGRSDFYEISESLFTELRHFIGLDDRDEWNRIQVSFFKSHHFHTPWAKEVRAPVKAGYLKEINAQLPAE